MPSSTQISQLIAQLLLLTVSMISKTAAFVDSEQDGHGRLRRCFWMTQQQKEACELYCDVLEMDVTHSTNRYNLPLCAIVGVDRHNNTVLLAQAILQKEDTNSFQFVLNNLKKASPGMVVLTWLTDADAAETAAIAEAFPDSLHFRCKWHLLRDVNQYAMKLGDARDRFTAEFARCQRALSPEEFDRRWAAFREAWSERGEGVAAYLRRLHNDRHRWALYHQRHAFTLGMSSTQRVESFFALLKRHIHNKSSLCELADMIDGIVDTSYKHRWLKDIPQTDGIKASLRRPLVEHFNQFLADVQRSCSSFIHGTLQREMLAIGTYLVEDASQNLLAEEQEDRVDDADLNETTTELMLALATNNALPLQQVINNVTHTPNVVIFHDTVPICSCMHGVQFGLPCRHVLAVCYQKKLPARLSWIHPRWFLSEARHPLNRRETAPFTDVQALVSSALHRLHPRPPHPVRTQRSGTNPSPATRYQVQQTVTELHKMVDSLRPFLDVVVGHVGELAIIEELRQGMMAAVRTLTITAVSTFCVVIPSAGCWL